MLQKFRRKSECSEKSVVLWAQPYKCYVFG
jgi:hypothetical protein